LKEVAMLKAGDSCPALAATSYDGWSVDLGAPGKHTVLWFSPKGGLAVVPADVIDKGRASLFGLGLRDTNRQEEALMSHPRAKLTPEGRLLVVKRVTEYGWTPAQTAEALGVSRATVYKWLRRYTEEGTTGLLDRTSRPHRSPRALPGYRVEEILSERKKLRLGPHQLAPRLGLARSTIYGVLRRGGLSRLADLDRTTRQVIRYQKERPGELLHLDTKKLARIPEGGGHKLRGRSSQTKHRGAGYEYLHVAVDDCTRAAYVEVLEDQRGATAAAFLGRAEAHFARQGIRIEAILTDRAFCYTNSVAFPETCSASGIRHRTTRPYRPQTNGKAERFIRTLLQEWAYAELYVRNEERRRLLPDWLGYYNHDRPHTALGGASPMPFLVNKVCGHYT
jgi:transposase InsO family protein